MEHDAYSGGGEDLGDGGSLRPFGTEFKSFDPRLESARFDSSRMEESSSSSRFDSSFRASEDFNADHFHDERNKDGFDDFKGASTNGFEHHPPPIYENSSYEEPVSQGTGISPPPVDSQSFGSESPSDFAQRSSEYSGPDFSPPVHMNGGGFNAKELDEDFFAQKSPEDGNGGAVLPPPEEMEPEEGHILREWKRQNALHLEEKERIERERLRQIIGDADDYKDELIAKRKMNRDANIKKNRDQEKVYLGNQENFHKNADKAYWKAVSELLPKELPPSLEPKGRKDKEKKEKKSTFVAIKGPKPGKPTDLGCMRQVLLKLKHNPPAHMIPPPPPPPKPEPEAAKEASKGEKPAEAAGVPPENKPTAAPEAATPESAPVTA